jgi:hypothetical protein
VIPESGGRSFIDLKVEALGSAMGEDGIVTLTVEDPSGSEE